MKRFAWRLQRVLDIRKIQEQKKRTELLELTGKLVSSRGELLMRKKVLEDMIRNIAGKNPKQRLAEQEFFLAYSKTSDLQIKKLKEKINELEIQQKEKIAEVIKIKRYREGMEKLRTEAKMKYIKEQEKIDQKELDERASVSFVLNS